MKPRPSLFQTLLAWTLGALVLVWATFIFFGYQTGIHEADELTDGHLASVAALLLSQNISQFAPTPGAAELGQFTTLKSHDYQQSLSVIVWDREGRLLARTGEAPTPDFSAQDGFDNVTLGSPGLPWRTFSRWNAQDHDKRITVMLSLEERDDLAEDIARQVAAPGLWLLPVVTLVLVLAVRRGLRPLLDLSEQVRRLDIARDSELKAPPHREFLPVVQSVNMLIARYNAALERERQLANEVAHELRTPLASIALHTSLLNGQVDGNQWMETLAQIRRDAARAGAVMADLLALARASRAEMDETAQMTDLSELVRRVASEFGQVAHATNHDIAVEASNACAIVGHPLLIEIAIRNLIENAIAHTPSGTSVLIRVDSDSAKVEVIDDGLRREAHQQVASVSGHLGLGLGHQVARRVAEIHRGSFSEHLDQAGGTRTFQLVLANPEKNPFQSNRIGKE